MPEETPVLIVGGALTGLSSAVFLAWHGVKPLVIEKHPDTLSHPRARGINPRTGEVYRQVGLEQAMWAETNIADFSKLLMVRAETPAGPEIFSGPTDQPDPTGAVSPCEWVPVLVDRHPLAGADRTGRVGLVGRTTEDLGPGGGFRPNHEQLGEVGDVGLGPHRLFQTDLPVDLPGARVDAARPRVGQGVRVLLDDQRLHPVPGQEHRAGQAGQRPTDDEYRSLLGHSFSSLQENRGPAPVRRRPTGQSTVESGLLA